MATASTTQASGHARRSLLLWGGGLLALGLVYRSSLALWLRMLRADPEESIGLLVPAVVGYLVWRRRDTLRATPARASVPGALVFLATALATAFAHALWFETGTRFGLYCSVVTLTWAVWGLAWLRVLAVPLLFLFFAQPLPVTLSDAITHPLRLLVTHHAAGALSLFGLPSVAEGVLLHLPNATLETSAACSGLRGFIASVALAVLVADVIPGPRLTTACLFPGALLAAYGLNVVRIMLEAVWTWRTGAPSASAVHELFGLLTFSGVALALTVWQLQTSRRYGSSPSS